VLILDRIERKKLFSDGRHGRVKLILDRIERKGQAQQSTPQGGPVDLG